MILGGEITRPNVSCGDGHGWPLGIELHSKFNQVNYLRQIKKKDFCN